MRIPVSGRSKMYQLFVLMMIAAYSGCATSGGHNEVHGNDNGSTPINENEAIEYQKSINRCTRTGGTRVVKIKGELRCY